MSKSNTVRIGLMGSAAALALLGTMSAAQAVETQFGDVSIVFDTTFSVGASVRTADRESQFLPESNGGPIDPRSGVGDSRVIPAAAGAGFAADLGANLLLPNGAPGGPSFAGGTTGRLRWTNNVNNHDGSANGDDARLNFDSGDLIGGNVKANHDLVVKWHNYTVFARAVGFYDVIMNDEDVGARSKITDAALGDVGRNYELLDLFLSADYTVADMPVNIRVGKQVINWGESTFILGGNNVFNPIDVGAFRRPGSEIKEALVPVNAVSGSISLPFDVSLSGYYALDWEPFELDASGTPFSTSDVVTLGSGQGGNINRQSFLSGSPFTGPRRVCDLGAADGNTGLSTIYVLGLLPNPTGVALPGQGAAATGIGNGRIDCLDSPFVNKDVPYTLGQHEATRFGLISSLGAEGISRVTSGITSRDNDVFADDSGQFGVAAKWYAESLGGTEFSLYYQNYHSRLPFVSERVGTMTLGVAAGSHSTQTSGAAGKLAGPTGCLAPPGGPGAFNDPRLGSGVGGISPGFLAGVPIADPQNLLNPVSLGTAFAITGANGGVPTAFNGGDNIYNAAVLNCALMLFQSRISGVTNAPTLFDGSETLAYNSDIGVFIEYPEDIEALGLSFNTVLFGWGVQGDFTYRDEAPFQIDTDSLTIAAAMKQCAFASVGDLMSVFEGIGTYKGVTCLSGGTVGNTNLSGVMRNQMFTAQIGTTSQFTGSDWWVDAIGGDIATVVTEIGMTLVPGVEDTWIDKTYMKTPINPATGVRNGSVLVNQYQNIGCQGSDLPLGGLLGIDAKTSKQCRPNDFSAGLVALVRVDYNNAFDTGFVITPQLVYSYDFEGTTPAPYSNYLEDRQSVGVSVTGTLNNNFRVGASYSNFFGGHVANKSKDTDFASLTASYTY
jgi:Protein of unknown function (DUF1302)